MTVFVKRRSATVKFSPRKSSRLCWEISLTRNFDSGFCSNSSWGGNFRFAEKAARNPHHRKVTTGLAAKRIRKRTVRFQCARQTKVMMVQSRVNSVRDYDRNRS